MNEPLDPQLLIPKRMEVIRESLVNIDWGNYENVMQTLQDLISLFVSLDTIGEEGKNIKFFSSVIEFLLEPLTEKGFIKIENDKADSPFLIIHPGISQAGEILKIGNNKIARFKQKFTNLIHVPKVVLHCHYDTVKFRGTYGMNVAYTDKENSEMIYGRGTNDMKGQLGSIILLLYKLFKEDNRNFLIFISSTEEYDFKAAEKYLGMVSAPLSIDLEPTSTVSGVIVEGIETSRNLIFESNTLGYVFFERKFEYLQNIVGRILEDSLGRQVPFRICYEDKKIIVSITEVVKIKNSNVIYERIQNALFEIFDLYFKFENNYKGHNGYKTNLSNYARSVLTKSANEFFPIRSYDLTPAHFTEFSSNGDRRFGKLRHRFATMLTEAYGGRANNTIITSIAERGPRHGAFESSSLVDLTNLIYFLGDVLRNFDPLKES